jgi:hypothetical protein
MSSPPPNDTTFLPGDDVVADIPNYAFSKIFATAVKMGLQRHLREDPTERDQLDPMSRREEEERVNTIIYVFMDQWPRQQVYSIWATARLAPMAQSRPKDNFMMNGTPPCVVLDLLRHHQSCAIRAIRHHPLPLSINRQISQGPLHPYSGHTLSPPPPYTSGQVSGSASLTESAFGGPNDQYTSAVSVHVFGGMLKN